MDEDQAKFLMRSSKNMINNTPPIYVTVCKFTTRQCQKVSNNKTTPQLKSNQCLGVIRNSTTHDSDKADNLCPVQGLKSALNSSI
jgi:hypothetical protein